MSKIVQAVNVMILRPDLIDRVIRGHGSELYFLYKGQYKWSILPTDDGYTLFYYPGEMSLEEAASAGTTADMVAYPASELGTREAKASFAELYRVLKERLYGIDRVLDDILGDTPF